MYCCPALSPHNSMQSRFFSARAVLQEYPFPFLPPLSLKSDEGQADLEVFLRTWGPVCYSNPGSPFLLLALTPASHRSLPGQEYPSVPRAAQGQLLLSFHHSVSCLIQRPRLFRQGINRGFAQLMLLPVPLWLANSGSYSQSNNSHTHTHT